VRAGSPEKRWKISDSNGHATRFRPDWSRVYQIRAERHDIVYRHCDAEDRRDEVIARTEPR
jgi:hypothetical protein